LGKCDRTAPIILPQVQILVYYIRTHNKNSLSTKKSVVPFSEPGVAIELGGHLTREASTIEEYVKHFIANP
jgi:hypothetical protein